MNHSDSVGVSPPPAGSRTCCRVPVGDPENEEVCGVEVRFEIARHAEEPLRVCPVHLGPSLLFATRVLWPPQIALVR
ncbi:hypothetical protein [Streptomyces spectabilis]|uniref:Uncharacterized protein n=1 Tax=Streptomyces spectabilis TaxID=68270 RepID=A0A516R1L5_STRST|nr:hypothetical protein [Streptomyces spectabilis]QDQ09546.1 hypothetical protein FH965_02375 [Streptomyces spectabilis]